MAETIVSRLRTLQDHYPTSGQIGAENRIIFSEAADEIERLRRALAKIADYSPASTIQPVAIAREALSALPVRSADLR